MVAKLFVKQLLPVFLWAGFSYSLSAQITYTIEYKDSLSSKIHISITPTQPQKGPLTFVMPRSVPGTYSMISYDNFIEAIHGISTNGKKMDMRKDENNASRWYCTDTTNTISQIHYTVDLKKMEGLLDPSDASIIRPGFIGLLNYSILGWIDGTIKEPVQCTVHTFNEWPIFTTNHPSTQMAKGVYTFSASNYYALADGQFFIGPKTIVKEFRGIVPLFIAAYCETREEYLDDYGKQGVKSMEILHSIFGELPFNSYSILLRKAVPLAANSAPPFGMEHLKSSTFFGDTSGIRLKAMHEEALIKTMTTYLHHMGHAFIPMRCYGDNYRPYVEEIPHIINNIWFNEGFMWFLAYEKLKSSEWEKIFYTNTYKAALPIKKLSLQELSQTASLMYAADFRLGKAVYSRGAMMAIEMNNYVKEKTGGKKSMLDALQFLYNWTKKNKRAFSMDEFPILLNESCGVDLSHIYKKWQQPIE